MGLLPGLFGVLRGAEAVLFLKAFAKVGRVLKPDPVGDFAHIDFVLSKQLANASTLQSGSSRWASTAACTRWRSSSS